MLGLKEVFLFGQWTKHPKDFGYLQDHTCWCLGPSSVTPNNACEVIRKTYLSNIVNYSSLKNINTKVTVLFEIRIEEESVYLEFRWYLVFLNAQEGMVDFIISHDYEYQGCQITLAGILQ